jgi:hypothetical protein
MHKQRKTAKAWRKARGRGMRRKRTVRMGNALFFVNGKSSKQHGSQHPYLFDFA